MTAPIRLFGITPRVRTTSAASRAILIKASIAGNMRLPSPVFQPWAVRYSLGWPAAAPQQKSPGTMPGASMLVAGIARSVTRDRRAAEPVVHAGGDEIDVLTDAVGAEGCA